MTLRADRLVLVWPVPALITAWSRSTAPLFGEFRTRRLRPRGRRRVDETTSGRMPSWTWMSVVFRRSVSGPGDVTSSDRSPACEIWSRDGRARHYSPSRIATTGSVKPTGACGHTAGGRSRARIRADIRRFVRSIDRVRAAPFGTRPDSPGEERGRGVLSRDGAVCSLPSRAGGWSLISGAAPDPDGRLRRASTPGFNGRVQPSLALEAVISATSAGHQPSRAQRERRVADARRASRAARREEHLLLRYRGARHTFPYVSAVDVLSGQTGPRF